MKQSIKKLENWVDRNILSKGRIYYQHDSVHNLAKDGSTWGADVQGTQKYNVEVEIRKNQVNSYYCDCPYDWGPMCKHVAATLFAIRDELKRQPVTHPTRTKKDKAQPTFVQIINNLSTDELRRLITYFSKRHPEVKSHLLANYNDRSDTISSTDHQQLVRSLIASVDTGRYGFIVYRQADQLGTTLYRLLADNSSQPAWQRMHLAAAVLEQTADVIQEADNSSGGLGSAIRAALEVLATLVSTNHGSDPELVRHISEYARTESYSTSREDL